MTGDSAAGLQILRAPPPSPIIALVSVERIIRIDPGRAPARNFSSLRYSMAERLFSEVLQSYVALPSNTDGSATRLTTERLHLAREDRGTAAQHLDHRANTDVVLVRDVLN